MWLDTQTENSLHRILYHWKETRKLELVPKPNERLFQGLRRWQRHINVVAAAACAVGWPRQRSRTRTQWWIYVLALLCSTPGVWDWVRWCWECWLTLRCVLSSSIWSHSKTRSSSGTVWLRTPGLVCTRCFWVFPSSWSWLSRSVFPLLWFAPSKRHPLSSSWSKPTRLPPNDWPVTDGWASLSSSFSLTSCVCTWFHLVTSSRLLSRRTGSRAQERLWWLTWLRLKRSLLSSSGWWDCWSSCATADAVCVLWYLSICTVSSGTLLLDNKAEEVI